MAELHLVGELLAGELHLGRVDDDDEITDVDMRGVLRLALTLQYLRDLTCQPAERNVGGVDKQPLALDLADFRVVGLH